jgi:hypothetical protein
MQTEPVEAIEIFCVYAQVDELFCDELAKHLSSFVQQGQVIIWHERLIGAGENRVQAIEKHLSSAHVIVLLMSADFLYSEECMATAQQALERQKAGAARVIPLILRPVDWTGASFAGLQSLPTSGKPVANWSSYDDAFVDVVQGLRSVIQELAPAQTQRHTVPHHLPVVQEVNRPTTVFLSALQEESAAVQDLQTLLNLRGLHIWNHEHRSNASAEEKIYAIEQDCDAFVIYATSRYLTSDLAWRTEIPAALRRREHDQHFLMMALLDGVTVAEFQHYCLMRGLPSLADFHCVTLSEHGMSGDESLYRQDLRSGVMHILRSALTVRWQRLNGDRSYEPGLFLQTFPSLSPTSYLDLDLNWTQYFPGKDEIPEYALWKDELLPALEDVKNGLSTTTASRRLHVGVQAILAAAFALGYVFRESSSFTLLLEGHHGIWSTSGPVSDATPLQQTNYGGSGDEHSALIELAISRETARATAQSIPVLGLSYKHHLHFTFPGGPDHRGVKDDVHARTIVYQLGRALRQLHDREGVTQFHLFASLPAALAVMVGHQCNALGTIHVYHYKEQENLYVPVYTLGKAIKPS